MNSMSVVTLMVSTVSAIGEETFKELTLTMLVISEVRLTSVSVRLS